MNPRIAALAAAGLLAAAAAGAMLWRRRRALIAEAELWAEAGAEDAPDAAGARPHGPSGAPSRPDPEPDEDAAAPAGIPADARPAGPGTLA